MGGSDAGTPRSVVAEGPVPVFEQPPAVIRFFDRTEEVVRSRLAKLTFFQRVFQLDRDWMTRITMLMVVASVFWGIVGAFDIFGFETQVTAFALGQSLHLSNQEIYSSLTLHGIRMLFGFAQQLELALFGIIFVTAFGLVPRHKWAYYLSVLLVNLSMVLMEGPFYLFPQFNDNYFPALGWYFYSPLGIRGLSSYVASPLWYLGWIALSVGVVIWAAWMLIHFLDWWRSHRGQVRRIPPFALFVLATVILIPLSYATVLASSAWDLLNYFGVGPVDPLANQVLFWFFGHGIVYILFLIPITAFYFLVPIFAKRPIYSYRAAFAAAVIFTILTPVLSIHHLYLTPVPPWSAWLTMALTFFIIVPSAITFFTVWMTTKGVRRGEWQWNAVTLFLLLSFAGTMAGGLTGPDNNTLAFDIDLHNTMFIVSHFHAIALLSIAAGGFAVVYAAFPLLAGRLWYSPRLAQAHFVSTAIGWSGLVLFMDLLGSDGILRRSLIFPLTNAVVSDQVWLFVFVIISIGAQLFFVANVLLTLFKGELLTVQGLSLDEIVRKMAQSTHPKPTVPISDRKFERSVPRARRERAERTWITVVVVLILGVLVTTSPLTVTDSTTIGTPSDPPAGAEYFSLVNYQYYWGVQESGLIHGSYSNVMVVHAGQWVAVNATAQGATGGFYLPFRNLPTVDIQVIPDAMSYWLFQAPSVPGVYAAPDSEYNGPWFGQDVAALVVLPATGSSSLAQYQSNGGEGDIYNPPVMGANGAFLLVDQEGLFDNSVPGPTLTASPGAVSFQYYIPTSSIGIDSYLVNVTSNDPNGQLNYLAAHNYTLPYKVGIYAINTTGGNLVPVTTMPLRVGSPMNETATLPAGVYVYGLVSPIPYVYNPAGESNWMTGSDQGDVMGMWGILWVSP
ncbi:MAG TPA: cbb3-type cytochrome c oxidase subunit I [Thermoplasmata archaeon]|nr:cbb3-type cytochrome c oxidase subunit I [Thermoplasmata archaeon]